MAACKDLPFPRLGFLSLDGCLGGCLGGLSPMPRRRGGCSDSEEGSPTRNYIVTSPTERNLQNQYSQKLKRCDSDGFYSCRSQESDDESTEARSSVLMAAPASSEATSEEQAQCRARLASEGIYLSGADASASAASSSRPAKRNDRPDWWDDADLTAIGELKGCVEMTRLLEARVIAHGERIQGPLPWAKGESSELYEAMGMCDPTKKYMAIWNRMGDRSVLIVSEVVNLERFEDFCSVDFMLKRLKLIMNPVKVKIPFIMKGPRSAETVGQFFGMDSSYCSSLYSHRSKTSKGVEFLSMHIDLHSKWILKVALQTVAFRLGNTVDLDYVDWDGQAVVAALRLHITEEGLEVLSHGA